MPVAPKWAQDLVLKVLEDEKCDRVPDLTWTRAKSQAFSSGTCYPDRIHISAGMHYKTLFWRTNHKTTGHKISARKVQTVVLLHELAHWIVGGHDHHSDRFWDKAWELFRRYKPAPIGYIKVSEGGYRKGAIAAYKRSNTE